MHILFLSSWFPYPPNNGSKLRILNLLRGLTEHHQVSLLCFTDEPGAATVQPALQSLCDRIHVVSRKPFRPQSLRARIGYFSSAPRSFLDTFSPEMVEQIDNTLIDGCYDLVIGSQLNALSYAPHFHQLPALLEESELGVFYDKTINATSAPERIRSALTWLKLRHYMSRQMKYFRASTVVSERERELLMMAAPGVRDVEVIPNCVTVANYSHVEQKPKRNSLIFTGPFSYFANYEAMIWFLREVYPLIQKEEPETSLMISGEHGNRPLPPASNVTLTGHVDSVLPLITSSWCSIVPLHSGGGTRLKILEAMALRTPVVATTKGAEGLDVEDGKHLLIADTPQAYAQSVLRLFHEPGLRQQLAESSYELVCNQYDWSVAMPRFLALVDRVARS